MFDIRAALPRGICISLKSMVTDVIREEACAVQNQRWTSQRHQS